MSDTTSDFKSPSPADVRILVVDDEPAILELLSDFLSKEGYHVSTALNGVNAIELLKAETYHIVLSDLKMPEMNGLDLIIQMKSIDSHTVPIIMTGFGTLETAVKALKEGAFDYILKPFKYDQVLRLIHKALEHFHLHEENIRMHEMVSLYHMSETIGKSLREDIIFDVALETVYAAIEADFCQIILREGHSREFVEAGFRSAAPFDHRFLLGDELLEKILGYHSQRKPVLLDRENCVKFFGRDLCDSIRLHAFLSVPISEQNEIVGMIHLLNLKGKQRFSEGQRKLLAIVANRVAIALDNANLFSNLEETLHQTIEGLAKALEAKDPYTHGHSERVREYAVLIASALELDERSVSVVAQAALLHDIGKIGVDLTYINKPGSLSVKQFEAFKEHPRIGMEILSPIRSLADIVPMVYHHHERFDGKGYPSGLLSEDIPLGARILAVADSYDAMTSDRAYRKALDFSLAIAEIRSCAGTQFDPVVVEAFIREIESRVSIGKPALLKAKKRMARND